MQIIKNCSHHKKSFRVSDMKCSSSEQSNLLAFYKFNNDSLNLYISSMARILIISFFLNP